MHITTLTSEGGTRVSAWRSRCTKRVLKQFFFAALSFGYLRSALAQNAAPSNEQHFEYDQRAPLDVKELSVDNRPGVAVHDISYASPKGGRVPAYLVVPKQAEGKFAAVVWGHWMMPKSPTANRKEFLDEAIAIAPAGVVSLLIDAPEVRPGFKPDPDPLSAQGPAVLEQQVLDLRRGVDLLSSRPDVDSRRIAFVGHSFDSAAGAILDAVDKRLTAFVLMGGPESVRDYVLSSDSAEMVDFRKSVPASKLQAYLNTYAWADPGTYAARLGPAPLLFQYATHDQYSPVTEAKRFFAMSSGAKEIKFYDSNHALNAEARRDRIEFLRARLSLPELRAGTLEKIPQTQ